MEGVLVFLPNWFNQMVVQKFQIWKTTLACTWRLKDGIFPLAFLTGAVGDELPEDGHERLEKKEAINSGNWETENR